jgi:hypothetical protein
VAGTCGCSNELSGSIKDGEFLDYLQNRLATDEGLCPTPVHYFTYPLIHPRAWGGVVVKALRY